MLTANIVLIILFKLAYGYFYSRYTEKSIRQYRNAVFEQMMNKNIQAYKNEGSAGYISALTNDITTMEIKYRSNLFSIPESIFLFIAVLFMMFYNNVLYSIISILLTFIPLIISLALGNKMAAQEEIVSERNESVLHLTKDILSGFPLIQSFQIKDQIIDQYTNANDSQEEAKRKSRVLSQYIKIAGSVGNNLAQVGVTLCGILFILRSA